MDRVTDIGLTILFLLYFVYYTFMGLVWGSLSQENHYPYVLSTGVGEILILTSLFIQTRSYYIFTRSFGLILLPAVLYFDLKGTRISDTSWNNFKEAIVYLPTLVLLSFVILSLVRLRTVNMQKSG